MLRRVSARDLAEWKAAYILDASDDNPEVTEWDDKESTRRKLAEQARRKVGN